MTSDEQIKRNLADARFIVSLVTIVGVSTVFFGALFTSPDRLYTIIGYALGAIIGFGIVYLLAIKVNGGKKVEPKKNS